MGKTEKGAIWLDEKLLSPYDYFQFWRNTDDKDVFRFLKMFTDLKLSEVENMKDGNINDAKVLLAESATKMLYGSDKAKKALKTSLETFSNKIISENSNLPVIKIKKSEFEIGVNILDIVVRSKLLNSKSEARRSIKDRGVKINDIPVEQDSYSISLSDFKNNSTLCKLSHGKKKHVIIKLVN